MILIDGKATSKKRLEQLKAEVSALFEKTKKRPGLAVVRVGEDPASKVYVSKKIKTCEESGIFSVEKHLPESSSQEEVIRVVEELNADSNINGILVQLPLPKQINADAVLEKVLPEKDVDGFHPVNLGRLMIQQEAFVACTPYGIMRLLEEYNISIEGKRAVVIGRSRIVGRPMSLLLDHAGATVTVVHSRTKNAAAITSQADILVAAAGKMHLVGPEYVKEGAVVIDVGMHRKDDGKLTGDVDFEAVKGKVSAMTPVPGGVGPMTICSLLENTLKAFKVSL